MIAVTPIRRLFVVFALFLYGTCLANAQSLYQTDFEAHEGFVNEAPLSGSWSATDSSVVIADDESYLGAQSVFIPSANIENVVSLRFDPSGNTILFVDYYMQLTASLLPNLPALTTPETTALVAVHNYQFGVGEWAFLDGDGLGSGTWFHAGYRVPVDESYRTGWHRITLRLNLILNTWDAYIDGTLLATDLGFVEPFSAGSEAINIYGSSTGPSYLDNFSLSAVNPLFTDEDSDGLDDSFESLYGLDSSIDDRNLDPDSDGFTNVEEYKYSTDPTTSNTIVVELPENGNLTVINEANGNLQIVNDGQLLLNVPLDGAYNLQIIGKGNSGDIDVLLDGTLIGMLNVEGDVGTVRFNSSLSILADLNISGANTVLFNGAVSVEGSTSIKVSEDLILDLNSSLAVISGDLNGTVGGDFIVRGNSDISVAAGNAFFNVVGAIWLDDGSSLIVDNAAAAFGTMQLNSGKTITVSDNSSITTNNNYMLLIAQDYISLADNSTVTAAGGYVIIQTRRDLTVTDSEMSLNSVTLFVQVERSLHVVRSAIHTEIGIAQLSVFVNATVDENSSLTVNKGDLYAQVNGNLTVSDNSEVSVTEGSIGLNVIGNALVERNSRLKVTNSVVSGKSLQLIVSGTTTFDSDSVLAVDKTELNLFSFGNINWISSALTVSTGNAFIRTNANLSLTDSTLSINRGNLSVNVARSMYITGSDITAATGSFYLNTGVNIIMDAGSTLSITGGDLYANIFGKAVLGGTVYMQNLFAMYVQGNFTLTETGTLDAFIIYLSSGQNIAIDGRMDTHFGNGQVYLNTQDSIYMKSMDPITAEVLSVTSVTGIFLRTEVEQLTAQAFGVGLDRALNLGNYTGSAEIEIHEVDDIILNTMYNVDGPIRVVAGGTIQAVQIISATDAPGHNIGLMSTKGDLEVGFVRAGVTNGQISLSASGTIRELAGFDTAADVTGKMALIYAGVAIATGDASLELNVSELHSFAVADVIFETNSDVEMFLLTGDSRVHVKSWLGDIVVTRLLSNCNNIKLEAPNGIMDIGYLKAGTIEGFIDLDAGDNITLVRTAYDGQPGEIIGHDDIQIDSNSAIYLLGNMGFLNSQIDIDARGIMEIGGTLTAKELLLFADDSLTIQSSVQLTSAGKIQVYSQNDGGDVIVRGMLTSGSELQIKAADDLIVEASAELISGSSSRLDSENGRLIFNSSLEAPDEVVLLSKLEMQINGPIDAGGFIDIYTDDGNFTLSDILSSDRFVNINVEGEQLIVTGTITALEGVYINAYMNNYTEISGEISVSGPLGEAKVINKYANGTTTDGDLFVSGRIVAAGIIQLKTYGELELPTGSYLTGTENDAADVVELVGDDGVIMTGRVNTTNFSVKDSGVILTSDYSDRVLNYTGDALTFNSDDLVIKVDGDIDLSDVTVNGRIEILASGTITVSSLVVEGGVVNLESIGGDIIVHSLDASSISGVHLKAVGTVQVMDAADETALTSTANLDVTAETVLIDGKVVVVDELSIIAGGVIGLSDAGSIQSTASVINLTASNGDLLLAGTISSARDVNLTTGAALAITGIVTSNTSVIMDSATTLLVDVDGQIRSKDQIVVDVVGAIIIEGTLQAGALIDLYTEADLTLGAAAVLSSLSGSDAEFIRMDACKVLDEAAGSQVNGVTELRITESIANLEWDVHGSTTWMHVEDNDSLLDLLLDGESVLLVSNTALLGESAEAAYILSNPSDSGATTSVFLYALTIEVVTDLVTEEQTIHYTAEQLTNSTLADIGPVSDFDNIVSVTSEPLNHVDGLLGIEMNLIEIDPSQTADYQQALYSLLTRNG